MENVTDALVIAGSIFLLMLALAVAIFSFTSLKTQIDDVVLARDEVKMAIDENGEYINYIKNGNDIRKVGIAEIIASFRRMRKEEYDIFIYLGTQPIPNTLESLKVNPEEYKYRTTSGNEDTIIESTGNMIKLSAVGVGNKNISKLDEMIELLYNSVMGDKTYDEYIGIYKDKTEEGVLEKENPIRKIITYVMN